MIKKIPLVIQLLISSNVLQGIRLDKRINQKEASNPHRVSVPYPNCHDENKSAGREYLAPDHTIDGINPHDLQGKRNPDEPCGGKKSDYFFPHHEGTYYSLLQLEKESEQLSLLQLEQQSLPKCTSETYPDCIKEAKTSGPEDWIPREGPTNISGMPDGKIGSPTPLSEKAEAQKDLDDANKASDKIKDDVQKAQNGKLYPKKPEEEKEKDCVDDSRIEHENKPTADVADGVKEMREENKDRKRCTPKMPKDPDYNNNYYKKQKDGDSKDSVAKSQSEKDENPVKDMMNDGEKSEKKEKQEDEHPGDSKPKDEKEIQVESDPVCTSVNHPDCLDGTAADPSFQHDLRNPLDNDIKMNHLRLTNEGYAQVKSIPACNSSSRPKCIKEAKTAADESIAENMRHPLDTVDVRHPNRDFGYAQVKSIPACNSSTYPDCLKADSAAFFKPEKQDRRKKDYQKEVGKLMEESLKKPEKEGDKAEGKEDKKEKATAKDGKEKTEDKEEDDKKEDTPTKEGGKKEETKAKEDGEEKAPAKEKKAEKKTATKEKKTGKKEAEMKPVAKENDADTKSAAKKE